MPTHSTLIRPVALHRLFIRQDVKALLLERDRATIRATDGDMLVDLAVVSLTSARSLWLNTVHLEAGRAAFSIQGLTSDSVGRIEAAIADAVQRHGLLERLRDDADLYRNALREWQDLLDRDCYLTSGDISRWSAATSGLTWPAQDDVDLLTRLPEVEQRTLQQFIALRSEPRPVVDRRNADFAQGVLTAHAAFFDTVERSPLTQEQRDAIVHDEDNALVIAGAGTGKTSTIVGKVGFVLRMGWAKADEILLLAFTEKAAEEMRERIKTRLAVDIKVRTFHAMGLEVIGRATKQKPSVCKEASDQVAKAALVESLITSSMKDPGFRQDLLNLHVGPRRRWQPAWDFQSLDEYRQYLADVELRTFQGDVVKSFEECEIANWLTINGIAYQYERPYEVDVATEDHAQYQPDFYLPRHKIYIEHWGVNRLNVAASFMDPDRYREKMEWARRTHAQYGTALVETYSWERQEGTLLTDLEIKLRALGVTPRQRPVAEALELLNRAGHIGTFANLIARFIGLFKSATHSLEELAGRASAEMQHAARMFLRVFEKLLAAYNKHIRAKGEIDFEDMISLATEHARSGAYRSPFRYLIIDEFQDISRGRAELVLALRNQVPRSRVFAVGDDWQSIYRFNGSDISLMTAFEDVFGYTRRTALTRTFRFHDKLAAVSSTFVQKNHGQIRKHLTTVTSSSEPGIVACIRNESAPLDDLLAEIEATDPAASVFILARYRHLLPSDLPDIRHRFSQLRIQSLTAHASKGLEADYVILLGLSHGKYGFPSQIEDDPMLSIALPATETFPHAEERRLFYVAMTRARKRVYLVVDPEAPSAFAREIMAEPGSVVEKRHDAYGEWSDVRKPELKVSSTAHQPIVRQKRLSIGKVSGDGSGQPEHQTSARQPNRADRVASEATIDCPSCKQGRLVLRLSKYGPFYGCSKYPACAFKRDAKLPLS